jgi:hypothetical protein
MNDPGYKTTEFWAMVISAGFGVMILMGVITNSESNTILAYVNNIMGSLVTICSVASYIFSRGKVKSSANTTMSNTKLLEEIKKLLDDITIER